MHALDREATGSATLRGVPEPCSHGCMQHGHERWCVLMGTLLFLVVVVLIAIAVLRTKDPQKTLPRTSHGRTTTSYLDPPDTRAAGLQSRGCWVPPGTTVTVQGITIPGGMMYIGSKMVSLGYGSGPDPALINPKLSIHGPVGDVGYWPSYSQIPPGNRGDYLRWLAGGRRDPDADLCYPFLFFYGLERRLLFDLYATTNPVGLEIEVLVCEIEEMLAVYGDNPSFNGYARGLISHAHAWAYRDTPDRLLNTPVFRIVPRTSVCSTSRNRDDGSRQPPPACEVGAPVRSHRRKHESAHTWETLCRRVRVLVLLDVSGETWGRNRAEARHGPGTGIDL